MRHIATSLSPPFPAGGRHHVCLVLLGLLWAALVPSASFAAPRPAGQPPLPDVVDDVVFHEALRARGLHAWLEQDRTSRPTADEVEDRLRQRDQLLCDAGVRGYAPEPRSRPDPDLMQAASDILVQLISDHPANPARLRWQYELARDYLERVNPAAFERLYLYELPGRGRQVVRELSEKAIEVLSSLRGQISQTWEAVEAMDEGPLSVLRDAGSLAALETLDVQSAALMTWATLYQAITSEAEPQQRSAAFRQVIDELEQAGRLDLPAGHESEQANALLMAGLAERHLGQYERADARARQIIATLGRIGDVSVRQRLRRTALIAVLEQIRAVRDAGRYDAALQAVEQARQWASKSRSDEPEALVALTLLEVSVLHVKHQERTAAVGSRPASPRAIVALQGVTGWLTCKPCLAALDATWRQSSAHRHLLYEVLAPALAGVSFQENLDPFALVLLAGSGVLDVQRAVAAPAQLDPLLPVMRRTLSSPRGNHDPRITGELRYLLGEALVLTGHHTEAVQVMTDLAEQMAGHERAETAIRRAVTWAGQELREAGPRGSPESRRAFVRAVRCFRQRLPDEPGILELTYAAGAALENDGQFDAAAREYALLPAKHDRARPAALGQIRCWRQALEQAAHEKTDRPRLAKLAAEAHAAVRVVCDRYPQVDPGRSPQTPLQQNDCDQARLVLALAELLNHPAMEAAERAVATVTGFEQRFEQCPELLGPVLRQRILGLRELKRLSEAHAVLDQYLAADPDRAGAVMAGLLQTMHDEILASRQRHDDATAAAIAAEAIQVGESLLAWAAERPERLSPMDRLVIRFWHASALCQSGRSDEALTPFHRMEQEARAIVPADSALLTAIRLGKADAMLESGQAARALAIYRAVWQSSPEHSDPWWHAFVGSLRCHARLQADPAEILQSIRQQRYLAPDLGGGRWERELTRLEQDLQVRIATRPTP